MAGGNDSLERVTLGLGLDQALYIDIGRQSVTEVMPSKLCIYHMTASCGTAALQFAIEMSMGFVQPQTHPLHPHL